MKKALSLALVLILLSFTPICVQAIEEGEYLWQGLTVTVTAVNSNPMFSPAKMTEDQHAVAVTLQVPEPLSQDEKQRDNLYTQAMLVDSSGMAYPAGVSMTKGSQLTFLYAIPKDVEADMLTFQFLNDKDSSFPQEYIGDWEGSVSNIHLTFTINQDGTGSYTFEQSGYTESYDFAMEASSGTFSLKIPNENKLKIVSCEGTYQYVDDVLTLDVCTTFANGRQFIYSVPCLRVELRDTVGYGKR